MQNCGMKPEGRMLQNETGDWIHLGDFDLTPHIVSSFLAIFYSCLRLRAVPVLMMRFLEVGFPNSKGDSEFRFYLYSDTCPTFYGDNGRIDYPLETSVLEQNIKCQK